MLDGTLPEWRNVVEHLVVFARRAGEMAARREVYHRILAPVVPWLFVVRVVVLFGRPG